MLITIGVLIHLGHAGLTCDLLQCCCTDGVMIKTGKSRRYRITIEQKALCNLRRHGEAQRPRHQSFFSAACSYVRGQEFRLTKLIAATRAVERQVRRPWAEAALKTTVEQALIRGLATATGGFVLGLPRARSERGLRKTCS